MEISSKYTINAATTGDASVQKLRKSVEDLAHGVEGIKGAAELAKTGLEALGVEIGVHAFIEATHGAIEYGESIAKAAAQVGLGIESFQGLRFAAGQAGITSDEFTAAMQRFTSTVGAAANGSKKQAELFQRLGVSLRDQNGVVRDSESIFLDFADAVKQVGSTQQQARDSVEVFGRAVGVKMAPLIRGGREEIEKLVAKAKEAGAVLSDETAAKAEEAGDRLRAVGTVIRTQLSAALIELAPAITNMGQAFADAAPAIARVFAYLTGTGEISAIKRINDATQDVRNIQAEIDARKGSAVENFIGNAFNKSNDVLADELDTAKAKLTAARAALDDLTRAASKPAESISNQGGDFGDGPDAKAAAAAKKAAAAAERERLKAAREAAAAAKREDSAALRANEKLNHEHFTELAHDADATSKEISKSMADAAEASMYEFEHSKDDVIANFKELEDAATAAAEGISNVFEDALFAGFKDGVKGMLAVFERALTQMALDAGTAAFKDILQKEFSDLVHTNGGGSGSGGVLGALVQGAISYFGGSSASGGSQAGIGAATGASFVVPGSSSSGDNVIPIFHANSGERVTVTPRDSAPGGGGAVQIIHNIDARGADPAAAQRMQAALQASERRTIAAVHDMVRRRRI